MPSKLVHAIARRTLMGASAMGAKKVSGICPNKIHSVAKIAHATHLAQSTIPDVIRIPANVCANV